MVNRVVVGAHYGLRDWLLQRITALIMAGYLVGFLACVGMRTPLDFEAWRALFAHTAVRVFTLIFFWSLFYHAWVGIRDIFMDYIKPVGVRLTLQVLTLLSLLGYSLWTAEILWSI